MLFLRSKGPYENALAFLACLHRVANSSELRFRLFNRWHALQFVLALPWGPT